MRKLLFDVTIHVPQTGDVERKSIIAPNDVIARDRAVKAYVKNWNKPFWDDEDGKMVTAETVKESEVWCEIKFVREIDG